MYIWFQFSQYFFLTLPIYYDANLKRNDDNLKRKTPTLHSPTTSIPALDHRQVTPYQRLHFTDTDIFVTPDLGTDKKQNNKENITVDLTTATPSASTLKPRSETSETSQSKMKTHPYRRKTKPAKINNRHGNQENTTTPNSKAPPISSYKEEKAF